MTYNTMIGVDLAYVSGEVMLRLYKGSANVIARTSPRSLYSTDLVTFEEGSGTVNSPAASLRAKTGNLCRLKKAAQETGQSAS